jgi:hypothetical protein
MNTSRALSEHEKNYSPSLLKMLACCWGIEHFDMHLRGRKFVIYSDHHPLEKLSCMHKKMISMLEQNVTGKQTNSQKTKASKKTRWQNSNKSKKINGNTQSQ